MHDGHAAACGPQQGQESLHARDKARLCLASRRCCSHVECSSCHKPHRWPCLRSVANTRRNRRVAQSCGYQVLKLAWGRRAPVQGGSKASSYQAQCLTPTRRQAAQPVCSLPGPCNECRSETTALHLGMAVARSLHTDVAAGAASMHSLSSSAGCCRKNTAAVHLVDAVSKCSGDVQVM